MVYRLDDHVAFNPLSIGEMHLHSITSSAGDAYGGWSVTSNFVPLRQCDPTNATAATNSRLIATLIMDLLGPGNHRV